MVSVKTANHPSYQIDTRQIRKLRCKATCNRDYGMDSKVEVLNGIRRFLGFMKVLVQFPKVVG